MTESREEDPAREPDESRTSPRETVLKIVGEQTGEPPKILLRDSEREDVGSRYVDAKAKDPGLLPQGRGNMQILGEIARGGMGMVMKGHDTDLGRDVAVKVLGPKLVDNASALQRFIEEAQIGGQLQHPGIVPVYELGLMEDGRPYFTMKMIKGRTLSALLNKRKSPEKERRRFLSIFELVCQTMAYAHSKGVIHRDLKPANIMVGAFGEVQVVDWGLAKVLKGGGIADEMAARQSQFTIIETVRSGPGSSGSDSMVGSVLGTPAYMAPEQALGDIEKVDERADVFTLGGILCEILTGRPPYVSTEKERTIVMAAKARLDVARANIEACEADQELKELCLECLSPAPVARPQNAEELAQRVHDYLANLEERAHKAEIAATEAREERRRRKLAVALGSTVIAAVVAIGFVMRSVERSRAADRAEQQAQTSQAVDDAQARVIALQEAGDLDEALGVARATVTLVADSEDDGLRERAGRLVQQAQGRIDERAAGDDLAERNARLLATCESLRLKQIEANFGFSPRTLINTLEDEYLAAFSEYGIDPGSGDPADALETLRRSGINVEVALALDDWASLRRSIFGVESFEVEVVTALAFDLDPDPLRTRMREALLANDRVELLRLGKDEGLDDAPASSIWVLSQGLTSFKLDFDAFRVVQDGVKSHPDDFLLNFRLGDIFLNEDLDLPAIPYLQAAHSLRPDNGAVLALLGDALNHIGDHPRAARAYIGALERRTDYYVVHRFIGWESFLAGNFERAIEAYEDLMIAFPGDLDWEFEQALVLSYAGRLSMRELMDRFRSVVARKRGWTAWALVYHPDPAERDPELAIELLQPELARQAGPHVNRLMASAYLRQGRPEDALEMLAAGEELDDAWGANFQALYELTRAWAFAQLGDRERARTLLTRVKELRKHLMTEGLEPWEGSDVLTFQREVEALAR